MWLCRPLRDLVQTLTLTGDEAFPADPRPAVAAALHFLPPPNISNRTLLKSPRRSLLHEERIFRDTVHFWLLCTSLAKAATGQTSFLELILFFFFFYCEGVCSGSHDCFNPSEPYQCVIIIASHFLMAS